MRMIVIFSIAAIGIVGPAAAQAPRDCGSLWKEADVDSDGTVTQKEDAHRAVPDGETWCDQSR